GDAERGDERDDGDERLLPLREQIAHGDMQFERDIHVSSSHETTKPRNHEKDNFWQRYSRFLISGNRITSRIDGLFVRSITSRSIPTPSPPVGGKPYSRARM